MSPSVEQLAADVASDAEVALGAAKIAKEAADSIPKPDPREDPDFQTRIRISGLEQSMLARISPRHRNRWPELLAIDERIADFDRRQEELRVALVDLRGRRELADAAYAGALAEWMANGQSESRPVSEAKALDEAIVEAEAEYTAIDELRDRVLEERIDFIGKHRKRLVRDADRATEKARARYDELVDELAQVREELIQHRQTSVWAAAIFPHQSLVSLPPCDALLGGRLRATEEHLPGLKRELPAHSVFALLHADADYCASVATVEQAAAIEGVSPSVLRSSDAIWERSPEHEERQRREKEAAMKRYASEWGQPPAEYGG
jgi:hypothetical protein